MNFGVYRHFDAEGRLLYVGCSQHPIRRQEAHTGRASWARQITRIEIEWFDSKDDALAAEQLAIDTEAPIHNGTHKAGRGRKGPRPPQPDNAAFRIAKAFGGPAELAAVAGVDRSRAARWSYPKDRGGHDGVIPAKYLPKILAEARRRGLDVQAEHLVSEAAQ